MVPTWTFKTQQKIADALHQVTPDKAWQNLAACATSAEEIVVRNVDFLPQTPVYILWLCKVPLKDGYLSNNLETLCHF